MSGRVNVAQIKLTPQSQDRRLHQVVSFPGKGLQETTSVARWKMRVSSVASFIRCLSANSARYRSVNCLLDSAALLCGEKSSGINRPRKLSGLIRKKPTSLIVQVPVCL